MTETCQRILPPWWHIHPAVGWFIVILGLLGVLVPLIKEHIGKREKALWSFLLIGLALLELRTIHYDAIEQKHDRDYAECVQLANFKAVGVGIKKEIDNTTELLSLEKVSRGASAPVLSPDELIRKWGQVSRLATIAVQGSTATPQQPSQIQQGKRSISAEAIGLALKDKEKSSATIISDGTIEAGTFAKQLEIGLHMAGWNAGGDNIKMGDPSFFPDSLTVEVSANPANLEDHSIVEAKYLIAALQKQGVEATLRYTTLAFPPNFMRIKVAGQ